jgi:effector-binding domain-containing protein
MANVKQVVWVMLLTILGAGGAMATEEAKFSVVLKEQDFEIRLYEPHIIAETVVDGDFENAGSNAFSRLFEYISGNNQSRQEINMTSPVEQEAKSEEAKSEEINMTSPVGQQKAGTSWVVSFMMPASYSMESLPEPKDSAVVLRQVPVRHMAVIQYSGFWSYDNYTDNKNKLDMWITENRLSVAGEPLWARYNPPFMPWFLRRNEILVPIINPSVSGNLQ